MRKNALTYISYILSTALMLSFTSACHRHYHVKGTPGHIQKETGYNPASGKLHPQVCSKGKKKNKCK